MLQNLICPPRDLTSHFRTKFYLTLGVLLLICAPACRRDSLESGASISDHNLIAGDRDGSPGEGLTVPGAALGNPYALETIKTAYQNVYHQAVPNLQATHLYVRFLPSSPEEMGLLVQEDLDYWDFPLDRHILHYGARYHDPALADTTYTWLYAVVPSDFQFPSVNHEILERLVKVPYNTHLLKEAYRLTENHYDEPEAYLPSPYNGGTHLDYINPDDPGDGGGGNGSPTGECGCVVPSNTRYPSGCLREFDSNHNMPEPVRRVRVIVAKDDLGLFFPHDDETSDGGCWLIPHQYYGAIHIWVKFESDACDIKVMNTQFDLAGYSFTHKAYMGTFGGPNFGNIALLFNRNNAIGTAEYANWVAATSNNALHEYRDWAAGNGVATPPDNLKITITPFEQSGATPMLDKMPGFSAALAAMGSAAVTAVFTACAHHPGIASNAVPGVALAQWLAVCAPDVALNYNDPLNESDDLKETAYHEFGHASHFTTVSPLYWQQNIFYVINQTVTEPATEPYGNGTAAGAGRCAVIESWGYHVECAVSDAQYGAQSSNYRLPAGNPMVFTGGTPSHALAIEAFNPNPAFGGDWFWIPMGVYWDLWDSSIETGVPVSDVVNGISTATVFNSLTDHTDIPEVRDAIISSSPPALAADITILFASYGY